MDSSTLLGLRFQSAAASRGTRPQAVNVCVPHGRRAAVSTLRDEMLSPDKETSMRKRLTPSRRAGGADLGYTGPPRMLPRKPQERRRSLQKLTTSCKRPIASLARTLTKLAVFTPILQCHAVRKHCSLPELRVWHGLRRGPVVAVTSPGVGFQWRWSREPHAFGVCRSGVGLRSMR